MCCDFSCLPPQSLITIGRKVEAVCSGRTSLTPRQTPVKATKPLSVRFHSTRGHQSARRSSTGKRRRKKSPADGSNDLSSVILKTSLMGCCKKVSSTRTVTHQDLKDSKGRLIPTVS